MDSESSCQFACVDDERCQSYNFGKEENSSERFTCQLSHSDRLSGFPNFTEDKDFKYGGLQVILLSMTSRLTVIVSLRRNVLEVNNFLLRCFEQVDVLFFFFFFFFKKKGLRCSLRKRNYSRECVGCGT